MDQIPFGRPIFGEEEGKAILAVMASGTLVHGPKLKEFEEAFGRFTGAPHCVAVANCTAALHLAYFYLGIKAGDEVIVPAQTHTATAHAVELAGGKPVFIDAEAVTGNIDISRIEAAITPRTKALSIVHYLGMPVEMDRIMAIAKKHNLFVVEDCALATGTYYNGVHAGLHGDVGCFSFYPAKHMTTSEGGMLITKHEKVAAAISKQRAFGMDRHVGERTIPGVYDVQGLGFNYRMSEINAAMGVEQLKRLPGFLSKRTENHGALTRALTGMQGISMLLSERPGSVHSFYCHTIILDEALVPKRVDIIKYLNQNGVGTSIYYPHPVPYMTFYRQKYGYKEGDFPVAARISDNSIALPVGPHIGLKEMEKIAETLEKAIRRI
ncbi:MAG: DegT/DnrJ/EryC1/StrS family aminotransferase [Fibrobacteria bacterium]